jgi:hypothetical protein
MRSAIGQGMSTSISCTNKTILMQHGIQRDAAKPESKIAQKCASRTTAEG